MGQAPLPEIGPGQRWCHPRSSARHDVDDPVQYLSRVDADVEVDLVAVVSVPQYAGLAIKSPQTPVDMAINARVEVGAVSTSHAGASTSGERVFASAGAVYESGQHAVSVLARIYRNSTSSVRTGLGGSLRCQMVVSDSLPIAGFSGWLWKFASGLT